MFGSSVFSPKVPAVFQLAIIEAGRTFWECEKPHLLVHGRTALGRQFSRDQIVIRTSGEWTHPDDMISPSPPHSYCLLMRLPQNLPHTAGTFNVQKCEPNEPFFFKLPHLVVLSVEKLSKILCWNMQALPTVNILRRTLPETLRPTSEAALAREHPGSE